RVINCPATWCASMRSRSASRRRPTRRARWRGRADSRIDDDRRSASALSGRRGREAHVLAELGVRALRRSVPRAADDGGEATRVRPTRGARRVSRARRAGRPRCGARCARRDEARLSISFVAVGDVMVDVTASGAGHGAQISLAPGGSAVNAAIWAAVAGAEAAGGGRVGDHLGGRALRMTLEERDVRTGLSVDLEAATGTFLVVDGEIRADRGANARFSPDDLP